MEREAGGPPELNQEGREHELLPEVGSQVFWEMCQEAMPQVGGLKYQDITPEQLEAWYAQMQDFLDEKNRER